MDEKQKKIFRLFVLFCLVSILFHAGLFIAVLYYVSEPRIAQGPELSKPQEVIFVNPQDMVAPPPVVSGLQPMELADIAKPKVEKAPARPHFKAAYNSAVKEETTAARIPKKARLNEETAGEGEKGDNAKQPGPKSKEKPKEAVKVATQTLPEDKPPLEQKPEAPPEKVLTDEKPKEKAPLTLKDLELKPTDFSDYTKELKDKKKPDKDKAKDVAMAHSPDMKDITSLPSFGKPGLPGETDHFAHDFLPGVKIGDKTYLDAAAFPDVQYFTRLKRTFRMRFNPAPPLRHHLAGNRIVVGKVNVVMAVTVTAGGQLQELFVVRSSGIPGYDEEAMRTIRQSAPFSAPPDKILGKDHSLRMTWNFITYL